VPLPQASRASSTEPSATAATSSHSTSRNRRRPRKLNRDPTASSSSAAAAAANVGENASPPQLQQQKQQGGDVSREISALKARVEDIERQVREMLAAKQASTPGKSSRRRLHRAKDKDEGETEAQELERLRGDLVAANRELAALKAEDTAGQQQGKEEVDDNVATENVVENEDEEIEEIEEIPREEPLLGNQRPRASQRSVTLAGNYKFNLPAAVSDDDLAAVRTGLGGVQRIARKYMQDREGESVGMRHTGK
jgi:hypothetical protein